MQIFCEIRKLNSLRNLKKQYSSALTWPMLGLTGKTTGLPVRIYVSEKLDFNIVDTPHIKVQNNYNSQIKGKCFLVSIEDDPKIIKNKGVTW